MNTLALSDVLAIRAMEHVGPFVSRPEIDDALDRTKDDATLLAARARQYFAAIHGGSEALLHRLANILIYTRIGLLSVSIFIGILFGLSADWLGSANSEVIKVRRYAVIVFFAIFFAVYSLICLSWLWIDLIRGRNTSNKLLQVVEWLAMGVFMGCRRLFGGTDTQGLTSPVEYLLRPLYQSRSIALFISRLGCVFTIASLITALISAFVISLFSKPDYEWPSLHDASNQRYWLEQFPPVRLFSQSPTPALVAYLRGEHGIDQDTQRLAFTLMLFDAWILIIAVKLAFLLAYWWTEKLIPREFHVAIDSPRDPYPRCVIEELRKPQPPTIVYHSDPQPKITKPELSGSRLDPPPIDPPTETPVAAVDSAGSMRTDFPPSSSTSSPIDPPPGSESVVAWFDGQLPETFRSAFGACQFLSLTSHSRREQFLQSNWREAVVGFITTLAPAEKELRFLRKLWERSRGERVLLVLGDLTFLRENYQLDAARVRNRLNNWRSVMTDAGWPPEAIVEFDHDSATADSLAQFRTAVAVRWQRATIPPVTGLRRAGHFDRATAVILTSLAERNHQPEREAELLRQSHDAIRNLYQQEQGTSFANLLERSLRRTTVEAMTTVQSSLHSLGTTLAEHAMPPWFRNIPTIIAILARVQTHRSSILRWGVAGGVLAAVTTFTAGAALVPAAMLPAVMPVALFLGAGASLTTALVRLGLASSPATPTATSTVDDGVDSFVRSLVLWSLLLELAGSPEDVLLEALARVMDDFGETPIQNSDEADAAISRIARSLAGISNGGVS